MNLIVVVSCMLAIVTLSNIVHGQNFIESPRDTSVLEGETVVLRCTIRNLQQNQRVYWYRLSTREYITVDRSVRDTPQRNRLAVIGSSNLGEFHLQIRNTRASDAGVYRCGFAFPNMLFTFKSATLTVLRLPDPGFPFCEVSPGDLDVGDVASLTCRSDGGIPPADLTWSAGQQVLTEKKRSPNVLAVVVSSEHNGLEFICTATSDVINEPRTCSVTLLSIGPQVRIEPPQNTAVVGQIQVVFTCVAYGLPEIVRYEWLFNNDPVDGIDRIAISADGRTLIIHDIILEDDETPVHCTAVTTNGLSGTSGGLLRVIESMDIAPTTDFFNATIGFEQNGNRMPPFLIAIIIAAVLAGQILIILVVYFLHRYCNRMMKERRSRRRQPAVAPPADMDLNIYVGTGEVKPLAPEIDPETGTPTIQEYPVYGDAGGMGEGIYNGTQTLSQFDPSEGGYDRPSDLPPPGTVSADYERPDDQTDYIQQPSLPPVSAPPLSPAGSAGYSEVPFVEELDTQTTTPVSPPSRGVVIKSPPPNKAPPRLPADKRKSAAPAQNHPYQGLNPERPESQYLSLRHYDDVYAEQALQEGARLNGEVYHPAAEHDDDGYVYEMPPAELYDYDIPPQVEKREYTIMHGAKPLPE